MSELPDMTTALGLAQDNCAEEIAKFLRAYVPPSLWEPALMDMNNLLKHYDTTINLLPLPDEHQ